MTRNPAKLARQLTSAQRRALQTAFEMDWNGRTLVMPRSSVRMDVRARLFSLGLLGSSPGHPLTKLGREVRAVLREPA